MDFNSPIYKIKYQKENKENLNDLKFFTLFIYYLLIKTFI